MCKRRCSRQRPAPPWCCEGSWRSSPAPSCSNAEPAPANREWLCHNHRPPKTPQSESALATRRSAPMLTLPAGDTDETNLVELGKTTHKQKQHSNTSSYPSLTCTMFLRKGTRKAALPVNGPITGKSFIDFIFNAGCAQNKDSSSYYKKEYMREDEQECLGAERRCRLRQPFRPHWSV